VGGRRGIVEESVISFPLGRKANNFGRGNAIPAGLHALKVCYYVQIMPGGVSSTSKGGGELVKGW